MVPKPDDQSQELVNPSTGEITKRPFSDEELRNLDSLDSIKALLGEQVGNATDLGSGFVVLDKESKRRICGVPLLFLFWQFSDGIGEKGEKVTAHVVQLSPDGVVSGKFIINDGSTGIYEQLKEYTSRTNASKGLFVPKGLRASDYITTINGRDEAATTYYIDTSPAA